MTTLGDELRKEWLNAQKAGLSAWEADLNYRETGLMAKQQDLSDREKALTAREAALDAREAALDAREEKLDRRENVLDAREAQINLADDVQKSRAEATDMLTQIQSSMFGTLQTIRSLGGLFSDLKDRYSGAYLMPGLKELCRIQRELKRNHTEVTDYYGDEIGRVLVNLFGCQEIAPDPETAFNSERMVQVDATDTGKLVEKVLEPGWCLDGTVLIKAIVTLKEDA